MSSPDAGRAPKQSIRKVERIHPHVQEPGDRLWCAVRMEGAEDEVPGKRCLDPRGNGFMITHFPHHNHVRVRPQESSHSRGKVKTDFSVNLHLPKSFLGYFHGVFRCPDFGLRLVDVMERCVQCRRFTASCGSYHQDNAIRLSIISVKTRKFRSLMPIFSRGAAPLPKGAEAPRPRCPRKWEWLPPAVRCRAGILPKLDFAILRQSSLRDIQVGHDLEA